MEKRGTSEIETKANTGKHAGKGLNNHYAYFPVHHGALHFFENCLKLVFAYVNIFK